MVVNQQAAHISFKTEAAKYSSLTIWYSPNSGLYELETAEYILKDNRKILDNREFCPFKSFAQAKNAFMEFAATLGA